MSTTIIVSTIVSAVIIPFFAPLLMDLLCDLYVQAMNAKRGKPTWVVGTKFNRIILSNGALINRCYIYSVTWKHVILKELGSTQIEDKFIRMKKRDLMKATAVETITITK